MKLSFIGDFGFFFFFENNSENLKWKKEYNRHLPPKYYLGDQRIEWPISHEIEEYMGFIK